MSEISMRVIFGKRFRSLRMNGETQSQFAERFGLTRSTVAAYEAGRAIPPIVTLSRICRLCRCSMDWLIGLADAKAKAADVEVIQNPDAPAVQPEQVSIVDEFHEYRPLVLTLGGLPPEVCERVHYLSTCPEAVEIISRAVVLCPESIQTIINALYFPIHGERAID